MTSASTLGTMSPELLRVVERAQREPEGLNGRGDGLQKSGHMVYT